METDKTKTYVSVKGELLSKAIKDNNANYSDICKIIGMRNSDLSLIVHEKRKVLLSKLEEICDLLNINPTDIINYDKKDVKKNPVKRKKVSKGVKKTSIPNIKWNPEYFQECLNNKQMILSELCRLIKRSPSTICGYNSGVGNPSAETLSAICKVLDCSSMELAGVTEKEIKEALNKKGYTSAMYNFSSSAKQKCKDDSIETEEKPAYKKFESLNVVDNIGIINDNLLAMVTDLGVMNQTLQKQNTILMDKLDSLTNMNIHLSERIDSLEKRINAQKPISPITKTYKPSNSTCWNNNTCTESELNEIIKSEVKNCTVKEYKDKIYKIAAYMAKKENSVSTAILSKSYSQLRRVYGLSPETLKQETGINNTLDAIYANTLSREIFFNMMCKNAS